MSGAKGVGMIGNVCYWYKVSSGGNKVSKIRLYG